MIEALVVCYVRLVGSCGKSIEVGCDWEGVKEGVAKVYTRWLKEEAYVVPATCEYATGCASLSAVMPVADAWKKPPNAGKRKKPSSPGGMPTQSPGSTNCKSR